VARVARLIGHVPSRPREHRPEKDDGRDRGRQDCEPCGPEDVGPWMEVAARRNVRKKVEKAVRDEKTENRDVAEKNRRRKHRDVPEFNSGPSRVAHRRARRGPAG